MSAAREPPEQRGEPSVSGTIEVAGQKLRLVGLTDLFELFLEGGKAANLDTARELLLLLKSFNTIPPSVEDALAPAILEAYRVFLADHPRDG